MALTSKQAIPIPAARNVGLSDQGDPVRRVAALACSVLVALVVSRIGDVLPAGLHLPLMFTVLTLATLALSGAIFNVGRRTRVFVLYCAMTGWIVLGVPFSVWRSGALDMLAHDWLRTMIITLTILAGVVTVREVAHLMNIFAFAVVGVAVIAMVLGAGVEGGRLIIPAPSRLGNPNELGFVLLLGMPAWWRLMNSRGAGALRKCLAAPVWLLFLACFLRTGSRSGLLTFAAMLLTAFFQSPMRTKFLMAILTLVVGTASVVMLPQNLRTRFITYNEASLDNEASLNNAGSPDGDSSMVGRIESTEERMKVFWDSVRITARRPIFGVGIGNFMIEQNSDAQAAGLRKGSWLGTHNTYTQLSSECGVPVLILFLALLTVSFRSLADLRRRTRDDPRPLAIDIRNSTMALTTQLVGACVFLCFDHIGYDAGVYTLVNLVCVLAHAAEQELPPPVPAAL